MKDLEKIIDDTYKIGLIDAEGFKDYKTLKPGILKKAQALIDSEVQRRVLEALENIKPTEKIWRYPAVEAGFVGMPEERVKENK